MKFRFTSGGHPIATQSTLQAAEQSEFVSLALRLVSFANTINLTHAPTGIGVDLNDVSEVLDAFAKVGIGRRGRTMAVGAPLHRMASVLREVLAALEESPMPSQEWVPLTTLLGDDLVAMLVGTSISSVQRYRLGQRPTPDDIAARLHTVALIAADLAGSYNEFGIRRWFQRPRSTLGGQAPAEVLAGDWSPDDEPVRAVRNLAGSLLGAPAT